LFQGITDKIVSDESWDQIAESLARLIAIYQEELVKLQDQGRLQQTTRLSIQRPSPSLKSWSNVDVQQQPLPDPNTDALTGL